MTDATLSAEGSGEGVAPVVAEAESPRQAKAEAGDANPLSGGAMWAAGLVLALANFMVVLDLTIANVSVPNIAGGLGVSADEGTWTITSYAVAEAITVPLTGWLAGRFGAVRVFTGAMFMFGVFSALCGLAPSLGVLVVFRVFQGLAGGPMIPLSQTLLLRAFPKQMAGQAMGLWSMTTVVGPIAGPILGGLICDTYSWPWVFYINVPVALGCALLAARLLKTQETPTRKLPVDVVGLVMLIVWVGALQIMLDKGEDLDWFQSRTIVELALVAAIGFCAFVIWELTDANPIVNLRVFSSLGYTVSLSVLCLCFGSYFAAVVIVPLWLQTNMGYTATWAGYAVAPSGVFAVVMSPIVGRIMGKVDSRLLIFIGVMIIACTMFWRSTFASNINFVHLVVPQFIQGFGVPLFFVPLFGLALATLKPADLAGGAGLLSFARTMASAFATSVSTTFWNNDARSNRVMLLNQLDSHNALHQVGALGLKGSGTIRQLEMMVQSQAVMLATDKLFLALGCLMVVAASSIWLVPKPKQAIQGGGGH